MKVRERNLGTAWSCHQKREHSFSQSDTRCRHRPAGIRTEWWSQTAEPCPGRSGASSNVRLYRY